MTVLNKLEGAAHTLARWASAPARAAARLRARHSARGDGDGRHPDVVGIALAIILLSGLCLVAYPTVADWVNSRTQSVAVASYSAAVAQASDGDLAVLRAAAAAWNAELAASGDQRTFSAVNHERYERLLDAAGSSVMGTVEVPKIGVSPPVYHYATDQVLASAVGHLEWSSLPVGGEGTHCVLSGHRGLPSATLFSNLDRLREGDAFSLQVLGETLTYEVESIRIVEPGDTSALAIRPGEDLCTLVTCTPYGVNTQRLLVTGHRIANPGDSSVEVAAEARVVDPLVVAALLAGTTLLAMLALVMVRTGRGGAGGRGAAR